jgi:hypothetical protein
MTADRRAAEEALSEYDADGGTPLEQLKQELDRRAALVKAVCEAMHDADQFYVSYDQAIAAIDLIRNEVLEEAARVIENNCHDDMTRAEEAAAIRALKEAPCSSS